MRKLTVFNHVSLDAYFVDGAGEMKWAYTSEQDAEWNDFVAGNTSGGGTLVLGRITYELMANFWPTQFAIESMPQVAAGMNRMRKIVFSRTLDDVSWNNTTLVKGDPADEIRKMKESPGEDMVILGSGSVVSQLTQAKLIDDYQFVVNPVILGKGRTMFDGVKENLRLKLTKTRAFGNGNVLLCYESAVNG